MERNGFMTYLEIDKAICDIAKEMVAECKTRLDAIPKDNKTERKALQLEHGMYTFCCNAGMLTSPKRDGCLKARRNFTERTLSRRPTLSRLNQFYQQLDETEKMRFIAATQAEIFIKDQWLPEQLSALNAAEVSNDIQNAFELKIKIGAVRNMFSAWEKWRVENRVYSDIIEEMLS